MAIINMAAPFPKEADIISYDNSGTTLTSLNVQDAITELNTNINTKTYNNETALNTHIADKNNPHNVTLSQIGGSNINLIDNWDFSNPINHRGQTTYGGESIEAGYDTIDGWRIGGSGTITIESGYIAFNRSGGGQWCNFAYNIKNPEKFSGKTITCSIKGSGHFNFILTANGTQPLISREYNSESIGITSFTYTLPENVTTMAITVQAISTTITNNLYSIKMEMGTTSTLDNDINVDYNKLTNYTISEMGITSENPNVNDALLKLNTNINTKTYNNETALNTHIADKNNPHNVTLSQIGGSNINLIDNWDFSNPINHRGQTTYGGGYIQAGYDTIDGWRITGTGTITVESGYIAFNRSGAQWCNFGYNIKNPEKFSGKTITCSIKGSGHFSIILSVNGSYPASRVYESESIGITSFTYTLPENVTTMSITVQAKSETITNNLYSIKMEIGTTSTLNNDINVDYNKLTNDTISKIGITSENPNINDALLKLNAKPNINLLCNADFSNPINTIGSTTYTATNNNISCIDKWTLASNGTLTINSNNISLTRSANDKYIQLWQHFDTPSRFDGKTLTFSVRGSGYIEVTWGVATSSSPVWTANKYSNSAIGVVSVTRTMPTGLTSLAVVITVAENPKNPDYSSSTLYSAKVEIGSCSTIENDITGLQIISGTSSLTPGTSPLPTGTIYLQYE